MAALAQQMSSGHISQSIEGRSALDRMGDLLLELRADKCLAGKPIVRPHPLLITLQKDQGVVLICPASVWDRGSEVLHPFASKIAAGQALIILLGHPAQLSVDKAQNRGLAAVVDGTATRHELLLAIHNAFDLLDAKSHVQKFGQWRHQGGFELGELLEIAKAISTEREVNRLLHLILEKSRFITSADAGSIYVIEGDAPDTRERRLRFKLSQNDSVHFDSSEFDVPVSERSMAGYVALHRGPINIADVYDLPAQSPFSCDRSFDEKFGYRTKSMLCAPLLSRTGETVGVIQLINKKRDRDKKLLNAPDVDDQVIAFDQRSEDLLSMLASQAGIVLENALLYEEIQRMLEGFVRASVEAIEQRDPTTSGHSRRVAELTVALAKAVERTDSGPYREVTWTRDDLRELEYASLLHDFGKIGVREQVLVKAKKLFPYELESIRQRFELAFRSFEADILSRKVRILERGGKPDDLKALDQELACRREALSGAYAAICAANEPTILKSGDFAAVEAVARETFVDLEGSVQALLKPSELMSLSVTRGSLTSGEMDEIRSHVTHTFEFLSNIPWGKHFRRVATIAAAHHERLNGTGYPRRLHAEEIPLQSKMMSISDIFDALTASDRPYKKAVPVDKALDILGFEVRDQHLDPDLVKIFIDVKAWTFLSEKV